MINYATILSNYDDRLTLMEWLKKVEAALQNASLDDVTITQDQPDEVYFTFVFADGTSLDSPVITLPEGPQGPEGPTGQDGADGADGADGVSVVSASINSSNHLIIGLSSGVSIDAGEIAGMINPMTARDDLILGGVDGAPTRIAKGNAYDVLRVNDLGHIVWRAAENVIEEAAYYSTDPAVLIGLDADGHATEVPASEFQEALDTSSVGDGTISKAIGFDANGDLVKETPSSGGMTNPMTAQGDIIIGGASGTPTKLAKGTAGQVLTMNAGATAPEWQTPSGGGSSAPLVFSTQRVRAYADGPNGSSMRFTPILMDFTQGSPSNTLNTILLMRGIKVTGGGAVEACKVRTYASSCDIDLYVSDGYSIDVLHPGYELSYGSSGSTWVDLYIFPASTSSNQVDIEVYYDED